jgi:hypothetical protein
MVDRRPTLWPKCVEGVVKWNAENDFLLNFMTIPWFHGWTHCCDSVVQLGVTTMASNFTGRAPMFTSKRVSSRVGNRNGHSSFWVRGLESNDPRFDEKALAVFQADSLIPD